ncbi:hypothetical protein F5H01DRAFT_408889 [Linnemannia elongata]|nr:hypothetical protein F5H01DRAFT_408889 [Linnemannia elongata]
MFASQPLSGKDILLWDDIQAAFDNAVIPVRSRIVVLLFLNGPAFKKVIREQSSVAGVSSDSVTSHGSKKQQHQPSNVTTTPKPQATLDDQAAPKDNEIDAQKPSAVSSSSNNSDSPSASRYYKTSAQGHAHVRDNIGFLYLCGQERWIGVRRQLSRETPPLKKHIGSLYHNGLGAPLEYSHIL